MSIEISIARREVYTTNGSFATSVYEIQANENDEIIQELQLDSAAELLCLRDALSHYIDTNNLKRTE